MGFLIIKDKYFAFGTFDISFVLGNENSIFELIFYFDNVNNSHYRLRFLPRDITSSNIFSYVELIYYEIEINKKYKQTKILFNGDRNYLFTTIHYN